MEDYGLQNGDINFVVLPPPDMPTSFASGAIDGYFVGQPFCAKAELDGYGRVLYYARDIWPNFISCALVVHEDLIKEHPEIVQYLVRGIAQSGAWAATHRAAAAKLVAPYFRQDQKVLDFVLTSKKLFKNELTEYQHQLSWHLRCVAILSCVVKSSIVPLPVQCCKQNLNSF